MQLAWKKNLFFNEQNWRAANGVKTIWERLVIPYAVVNPDKILNNHEQPTFGLQCIMLRAALQQGSAIIGPGQNGWVIYTRMDRRQLCEN